MDIAIKSFNRPYYLERCIRSIYKFVAGDFKIHVMDDGTQPEYLEKISELFPDVIIYKSPFYHEKSEAIKEHALSGKKYDKFYIPAKFWSNCISKLSDKFLLLEEDMWLIAPVNVDEVEQEMTQHNIVFTKLFWAGNLQLIKGKSVEISKNLEEIKVGLNWLQKFILSNKFKARSIVFRLKLYKDDGTFFIPFYTIYAVASAFYDREYWLYLWKGAGTKVNEIYQLERAVKWLDNTNSRYAKSKEELVDTSFISSATITFKDINLDIFLLNHILNQAWLKAELNSMQNFPDDFDADYIKLILNKVNNKNSTYSEWIKWTEKFKEYYLNIGYYI